MNFYRFPRVKFADSNTREQQINHVLSELKEIEKALATGDMEHALEEMLDAIWSLETMIRIHCKEHGLNVDLAALSVEIKNRDRGYI